MTGIAQLAEREQKLIEELAEVRAEIAARAGQADEPKVQRAVKTRKVQKAVKDA